MPIKALNNITLINPGRSAPHCGAWAACLAAFCLMLAAYPAAAGISVSPISGELDLTRSRSFLVNVTNTDRTAPVPIKVSAYRWALDRDGRDVREATDDLVVFPGQFILQPGEQRAIRIGARAERPPETEATYRVLVSEVPVDLEGVRDRQTGVRVISAYAVAFYLRPAQPHSDTQLVDVGRDGDALVFTLRNAGNARTHLRALSLTIRQDGKDSRFDTSAQLPHFYNENLLAGGERRFRWTPPAAGAGFDPRRPFEISLEFQCEFCGGMNAVLSRSVP